MAAPPPSPASLGEVLPPSTEARLSTKKYPLGPWNAFRDTSLAGLLDLVALMAPPPRGRYRRRLARFILSRLFGSFHHRVHRDLTFAPYEYLQYEFGKHASHVKWFLFARSGRAGSGPIPGAQAEALELLFEVVAPTGKDRDTEVAGSGAPVIRFTPREVDILIRLSLDRRELAGQLVEVYHYDALNEVLRELERIIALGEPGQNERARHNARLLRYILIAGRRQGDLLYLDVVYARKPLPNPSLRDFGRRESIGPSYTRLSKDVRLRVVPPFVMFADFKACHPMIMASLARQHNLDTPSLTRFAAAPDTMRKIVASDLKLTRKVAKGLVNAVAYGAGLNREGLEIVNKWCRKQKRAERKRLRNAFLSGLSSDIRRLANQILPPEHPYLLLAEELAREEEKRHRSWKRRGKRPRFRASPRMRALSRLVQAVEDIALDALQTEVRSFGSVVRAYIRDEIAFEWRGSELTPEHTSKLEAVIAEDVEELVLGSRKLQGLGLDGLAEFSVKVTLTKALTGQPLPATWY